LLEIVRVLCFSVGVAQKDGSAAATSVFFRVLHFVFVGAFSWLWTKLGVLLLMKTSRNNEYAADEFAFNAGLGRELCVLFDSIIEDSKDISLFTILSQSHPDKDSRIAYLQSLGVSYP